MFPFVCTGGWLTRVLRLAGFTTLCTALAGAANATSMASPAPLSFATAVALAVGKTPLLAARAMQIDAARQAAIPAGELPDPRLALGIDNLPVDGADRYSLSDDFMTMRRVGLMQEFPNGAKRMARAAMAASEVAVAEAEIAITRQVVRRETALAWIARHTVERQLERIDPLLAENRLLEAAVQAQLAGGAAAADIVTPRQEAAAVENLRDQLETRRDQAVARLERWIGEGARAPLTGEVPDWPIARENLLHGLHAHPEVAMFAARVGVADATIAEARAAKKPDWALELAYQERGPEFSDMATVELSFDLPLFAARRQNPRIAARHAERNALDAEREATLREHAAMLDADLAEYRRLSAALARQNRVLLPLAAQKVELASAAWRGGRGSLADVVVARRGRIEADLKAIALGGKRQQVAARLHYTYGESVPQARGELR